MSIVGLAILAVIVLCAVQAARGNIHCGVIDTRRIVGRADVEHELSALATEYDERLAEMQHQFEERIVELENRVDFAERMLAKSREENNARLVAEV